MSLGIILPSSGDRTVRVAQCSEVCVFRVASSAPSQQADVVNLCVCVFFLVFFVVWGVFLFCFMFVFYREGECLFG